MSKWTALLAAGRDNTRAVVGYLVPLVGSSDRLEPMELPHTTPPPAPPNRTAIRQVLYAIGTERGARQLQAGGTGIVARMMANELESTSYRELRSDQIARKRAQAGRTGAKSTMRPIWLFAGDQSRNARASTPPTSMADAIKPCGDCG